MRVDTSQAFSIVYSIDLNHKFGVVIEPYAIQLTNNFSLSLTYQKLYYNNLESFDFVLDDTDKKIIKLATEYSTTSLSKKFSKNQVKPTEFTQKILKDYEFFEQNILPYIEKRVIEIIKLIRNSDKKIFLKGNTGNPASDELEIIKEKVSVHFHLKKDEKEITYYPTFKLGLNKINLHRKENFIVSHQPFNLISDYKLFYFESSIDSKKIKPFFSKFNISFPLSTQEEFYKKFLIKLLETQTVIAEGIEIITIKEKPNISLEVFKGLADNLQFNLVFEYYGERINHGAKKENLVKMKKIDQQYQFFKINRQIKFESSIVEILEKSGLENLGGSLFQTKNGVSIAEWLSKSNELLKENRILINQNENGNKWFVGVIDSDISIESTNDWFDVKAIIKFGDYLIPLMQLRNHILKEIREFKLPNGNIALLPDELFEKFKSFLEFSQFDEKTQKFRFKKHYFNYLNELNEHRERKELIEKIKDSNNGNYENIDQKIPDIFSEVLRDYQVKGFLWYKYLSKNGFGGILADDMGLGKTLQTLCFIHYHFSANQLYEEVSYKKSISTYNIDNQTTPKSLFDFSSNSEEVLVNEINYKPCLIVMPTSLIYNWQNEINKWMPGTKVLVYTGNERDFKLKKIYKNPIVLTTYGTLRNDIDILKKLNFSLVILDESHVIKNPTAKTTKAVNLIQSDLKFALTGTPIENSLLDLWSQMSFVNKGLLGNFEYFKENFQKPIEKFDDERKREILKKIINPFIIRRTKKEVAKELPEIIVNEYYSEMEEKQKIKYNQIKNYYREEIFKVLDENDGKKAGMYVLQGLTKLRLIANHPILAFNDYEGDSGKYEDITFTINTIVADGKKVLVFSQFVKHLQLIEQHLIKHNLGYSMLTGATIDREKAVNKFKNNSDINVFMMSLKAGGVGLNLVEADYVFICDPWWNPAAEQQAIDRAHRIGQSKNVIVYKFLARDTVEEKIVKLQNRKKALSESIIDSTRKFNSINRTIVDLLFS